MGLVVMNIFPSNIFRNGFSWARYHQNSLALYGSLQKGIGESLKISVHSTVQSCESIVTL